jgi:hypothetical protein
MHATLYMSINLVALETTWVRRGMDAVLLHVWMLLYCIHACTIDSRAFVRPQKCVSMHMALYKKVTMGSFSRPGDL